MKFDIADIGLAGLLICVGICLIISEISLMRRTELCEAKGGQIARTEKAHWYSTYDRVCKFSQKDGAK